VASVIFICTVQCFSVRIKMEKPVSRCEERIFEKMESFGTGDAHGR
jgi:hypothetical protein